MLVETLKHGYAVRSGLADPYFYGEEMRDLERRCTDPDFIEQLKANITEKTHEIGIFGCILLINEQAALQVTIIRFTTIFPLIMVHCMFQQLTKIVKWSPSRRRSISFSAQKSRGNALALCSTMKWTTLAVPSSRTISTCRPVK